jgi:iron complex outermembrane receptor protein
MRRVVFLSALLTSTTLAGVALGQDIAPVQEVIVTARHTTPDGVSRTDVGGGLMVNEDAPRVRQTVTRDFIAKQPPSANPEQLLELEPSANVTLGDPFGLSVGRMTIRGLDIGEIGFMFEGMPFNNGAVYPNEILDSENLSTISLTPGSIDFDVPSFGAVGGLVEMKFRDPSMTPGAFVNLSTGSDQYQSEFIRADSGVIGNTGVREFLSLSQTSAAFWHGPGVDTRTHADFKIIKDFGGGTETALSIAWNRQEFMLDRWPTLAQWNTYGLGWTYDAKYTPGDTNYAALHESAFGNVALSAPTRVQIVPNLDLAITPYMFHGYGTSPGGETPSNVNFSGPNSIAGELNKAAETSGVYYSPTIYDQYRTGVNAALTYHIAGNALEIGYWYENDYATTQGVLVTTNANGTPADVWAGSGLVYLNNGQPYDSSYDKTLAEVYGIYVGDRAKLLNDRLEIDVGFKEVQFDQQAYNYVPGETPQHNADFNIPLPTAAVRYRLNAENMIYANVGTNFLTPQSSQLFDVYSNTTGALTQQSALKQKPERSVVEELGYRYQGSFFDASLSVFNYNFRDRQISTSVPLNSVDVTEYINAGDQVSRGVDAEIGTRPWHNFRPFVSAEYLDAKNESNIPGLNTAGQYVYLPTAGKAAVRSPKEMASIGIDYDSGSLFFNISAHYVASQYSTFMNDQQIPAYETANAAIGYRLKSLYIAKTPVVQLNIVNISNDKYLGGVYTVQTNAKAAVATNGTAVAASGSPTYLAGAGLAAIFSVSASF